MNEIDIFRAFLPTCMDDPTPIPTDTAEVPSPTDLIKLKKTVAAPLTAVATAPDPVLPVHPAADAFPKMAQSDLLALAEDIRVNGLQQPIVTCRGVLIDGRNRLQACALAGVPPTFISRDSLSDDEVISYIISVNMRRRHLDVAQREAIAAKLVTMQRGNAMAQRNGDAADCGISRADAAAKLDVSPAGVERMRAVLKIAPDLAEKVAAGETHEGRKLTSSGALRIGKERAKEQVASAHADDTNDLAPATPKEPISRPARESLSSISTALGHFQVAWDEVRKYRDLVADADLTTAIQAMMETLAKKDSVDSHAVAARIKKLQSQPA